MLPLLQRLLARPLLQPDMRLKRRLLPLFYLPALVNLAQQPRKRAESAAVAEDVSPAQSQDGALFCRARERGKVRHAEGEERAGGIGGRDVELSGVDGSEEEVEGRLDHGGGGEGRVERGRGAVGDGNRGIREGNLRFEASNQRLQACCDGGTLTEYSYPPPAFSTRPNRPAMTGYSSTNFNMAFSSRCRSSLPGRTWHEGMVAYGQRVMGESGTRCVASSPCLREVGMRRR